jgi:peroxiredoxin
MHVSSFVYCMAVIRAAGKKSQSHPRAICPGDTVVRRGRARAPHANMTEQLPDERPTRRREYSGAASTLGVAMLIVIVVGLGLWFFQFRDNGGGHAAGVGGIIALPDNLNPTEKSPAAETGRAAPNFELASLDGALVRLDSFRGKYVLVNFWASWCQPCKAETPKLQQLYEELQQTGADFTILGVNQQETRSAAQKFTDTFSVSYPVVLDSSGEVDQAYHVDRGLPHSFLINPSGVVESIHLGELSDDDLAQIKQEVLS